MDYSHQCTNLMHTNPPKSQPFLTPHSLPVLLLQSFLLLRQLLMLAISSPLLPPVPSDTLCSRALAPLAPPQHSEVTSDTMSYISSKLTCEPLWHLHLVCPLPPSEAHSLLTGPPSSTLSSFPFSLLARLSLGLCPWSSSLFTPPL